jgi:hypothetical protein
MFFVYIFSLFFFYKIRKQEGGTSPAQGGELAPWEEGGVGEMG